MVLHLPRLTMPLLALTLGSVVLSAAAQTSDRSIIFSTPATDGAQAATPSLAPQNSLEPALPESLQAPDPALQYQAPSDFPDAPPPVMITPQARRMQKLLEDRKNWTLMTPAEILGVPPTDESLQPPERDALGLDKNPTQLERYLNRADQARSGPTNGYDQASSPWQFSRDRNALDPLDVTRDSTVDAARRLSEYLNGRRGGDESADRSDKHFGWDAINPPAPQTTGQPDLEQMAAMDRFRQLLNPSPAPTTANTPDNGFFATPNNVAVTDPNITQPDFVPNPAGASFTPLTSGIGKPTGLTPLPGITTPEITTTPAPAWAPQPAPWLSQMPQPYVMPQRKF
jgi:hypothetical protein